MAMTASGANTKCHLFYINDKNSDYIFLVHTEAEMSIIPSLSGHKLTPSTFQLQAANHSKIQTYGKQKLTLNFELC